MKNISNNSPTFPSTRLRRVRSSYFSKLISSENYLTVNDLIMPLFVVDGHGIREEIKSMPGTYRYSLDNLICKAKSFAKKLFIEMVTKSYKIIISNFSINVRAKE